MKDKFILLVALVVVFVINLFADKLDPYFHTIIIFVGINIILATSLNLINGYTGQFSLGHAGFMAIGAYVSLGLSTYFAPVFNSMFGTGSIGTSVTFLILMLIAGLSAGIVGLLVGVPSLRLKGDYLAIVTLGFAEIIRVSIQGMDFIGAAQGFRGVYIYDNGIRSLEMLPDVTGIGYKFYSVPSYTDFFWVFAMTAICIFFVNNLMNSTYGRAFVAVKDDEVAAEAMGINTTKFKVIAFVSGAFFAGVAGSLYGHFVTFVTPEDFNFLRSVEILVMVILGGMGSMIGVVIAAVLLTILPEVLRGVSEYRMIVYSLLLVILMLTRPQGLFGVKLLKSKK
ncbi:branched-chain amino acid ABC transporter permease [Ignavibacteria bacterium CHB1]|jgi:amino acid/amide ABC transporter membrane protein 2, HAAT family (TC 3.A.1.4.-)|nr:MAG: branched-chain amino acid ABC transporter permease [Chlorobiota bacterium]KXK02440.1 MAG: High-affinity branched-chain amino acid transport system permease protein LivH [Chlorobi bacterium OLB4]MBV6398036.1 hypothetical protein [Ignavibacteria bacterium]MCC6886484.1 branched-chain amino acid ABC transporter permease [Ignavibacteriales bacterium]MCE7952440.1 branched-chain amino acid ABC transporter permease [Chlorobi bacterium CHB7]MDL1886557.1 branched-chain amino acid ABC transporter